MIITVRARFIVPDAIDAKN